MNLYLEQHLYILANNNMPMDNKHIAPVIEEKVYDYLKRKASKGYTRNFNPLSISKKGIADSLNLKISEVEEALERLSGEGTTGKAIERVEPIKPKFEMWLPSTEKGKEIKNVLCKSGLGIKGNLNVLYSFILIAICYILIFKLPHLRTALGLESAEDYFLWAFIITAVSVPIGNYLAHKWYQITLWLQKVKGIKIYICILTILIFLITLSFIKSWDIILLLSIIATIANVILVVFQIVKKKETHFPKR